MQHHVRRFEVLNLSRARASVCWSTSTISSISVLSCLIEWHKVSITNNAHKKHNHLLREERSSACFSLRDVNMHALDRGKFVPKVIQRCKLQPIHCDLGELKCYQRGKEHQHSQQW